MYDPHTATAALCTLMSHHRNNFKLYGVKNMVLLVSTSILPSTSMHFPQSLKDRGLNDSILGVKQNSEQGQVMVPGMVQSGNDVWCRAISRSRDNHAIHLRLHSH